MTKLNKISTTAPDELSKKEVKKEFNNLCERIGELQNLMYAGGKHSLLVVLQGMDSSGKDGVTRNVFKDCAPYAISVKAFKKPSKEEMGHDFLWRVHQAAPEKGQFVVFNRSHYEDVLIQRVHGWIDEDRVKVRFRAINAFEELLKEDNNTTILKFYLHLSKDRQIEKLRERITEPTKNWKHNDGDWEQRKHWDQYMDCYEDVLDNCNHIPWEIIPADNQWYRNYLIAKKICATLEALNMEFPRLDEDEITADWK